ncbi:hypothetical protein CCH79_00015507 [Gambusia affinis]|uniref:Uncharacterized protein n=1 Tax=Gambusia affinis TaxID=33528 RepID=A0A315WAV8_GAMAF|nr:hypothetical protein CCH79_00015507 [Gambusia affinis]
MLLSTRVTTLQTKVWCLLSYLLKNASQGQTGLFSVKTERDPWRTTPNVGPESSFTFPGASPGTPTSSKEREIKPFSLPISNYRPENYLTTSQSTFNIPHKEEIKHQPIDQGALFTITQKETLSTSAPKMSASYGHQLSSTSCSSYNFLPDHKSTADDFSKLASNVSVYATREEDQPSYFDCNPQLAGNILENYGLEKADLDELLNYSEEQTTAENLPYLLQSIRMKKATRSAPGVRSNSDSMTRPTASTTGVDAVNLGKPGILPDKMSSSTLLHPVKTIKNEEAAAGSAEVTRKGLLLPCRLQKSIKLDCFKLNRTRIGFPTRQATNTMRTATAFATNTLIGMRKCKAVLVPAQEMDETNPSAVHIPAHTAHVVGGAQETESTNTAVDQDMAKTDPVMAPVPVHTAPFTTAQEIEKTTPTVLPPNTGCNTAPQGRVLALAPHVIIVLVIDHVQEAMRNGPHQRE